MKKIKLFLTSSLKELEHDLKDLGAFVGDLNDRYASHNIYFQLNISGENDFADDVDAAQNSELFYIIFHDEPQDRAKAEFEAAYASFHEKKTPKIITYYKQLDSNQPEDTALAFMDKLRNELGHFNSKYTHMDTVKLNVVLQLKSLGLEHIKVDVEGSSLVVDGKEMMTLDNIPLMFNNKNLSALKNEHTTVEKEFWELSDKVHKNPDDKDARARFLHLSGKMNSLGESMHELQMNIIKMETNFLKKAGEGYISPRLMHARQRFEDGDIEGAKQLLDLDTMMREDERDDEIFEEMKKKKLAKVNEYLYLANMLITDVKNPNRFDSIERAYEQAVKIEEYNLEKMTATWEYAIYLASQNNFAKALQYAKLYLRRIKNEESDDYSTACCILATIHTRLKQFDEAEELYNKALVISERLAKENPANYEDGLVLNYSTLAGVYVQTGRFIKAEELYEKALTIINKCLAEENFVNLGSGLMITYIALANLYDITGRYTRAEELYNETLAITEHLAEETPAVFEQLLTMTYNDLASLYYKTGRYTEAEELNKKTLAINERQVRENPAAVEPILAQTYNNLANLYNKTGRNTEAEELYKKELTIRERLAKESPVAFGSFLTRIYNDLANLFDKTGRNVEAEELYKSAFKWYEDAAKQGYTWAQNNLGACYYEGKGIEQDYSKAVEWYEKAAEQGNVDSQNRLGNCYYDGQGVEQDYRKAVEWYGKGAEQGYHWAQHNLGVCYYDGLGVEQDYSKAAEWFVKAAGQGNAESQNRFGVCYYFGNGVEQDYNKAAEWFVKAVEQGYYLAQNNLGNCYYDGLGVEQDYSKAVEWYGKAAEQGDADSQNRLGNCYYDGQGVEQDYNKAVEWYKKGAEQGYHWAQNNLGNCYYNGLGVEQDYIKAIEWYGKAAEQGNAESQNSLVGLYELTNNECSAEGNHMAFESALAATCCNLADLYVKTARYTEAEELYNCAFGIRENILAENPDDNESKNNLAAQLYRLGLLFEQRGRLQEAQAYWLDALDTWQTMNEDDIGDYREFFEDTRNKLTQGTV